MERTVITQRDVAAMAARKAAPPADARDSGSASAGGRPTPPPGPVPVPDDYKDRLLKYIPGDVIALYVALDGIVSTVVAGGQVSVATLRWIILAFVAAVTPLYLWRVAKVKKPAQIAISFVALLVWAFYLGGPFRTLSFYQPVYGALLFPAFTFLVPMLAVEE
ncbi:MAG: hypothetical protein ACJ8J0_04855 [Longimicrobiaceae bacterium]